MKGVIIILFHEITLQDKQIFDEVFKRLQYCGSECTFTNLFIWRSCYNINFTREDGFLILNVCKDNECFILPPFGGEIEKLPALFEKIHKQLGDFEIRGIYRDIIEEYESIMPGKFLYTLDRDNSDYIYLSSSLAQLSGRKYHQKKNHANSFRKNYPNYRYLPISEDLIPECLMFAEKWHKVKQAENPEDESLLCESCAIKEALNNFKTLGITGGVIMIDGQIEAMTFGEMVNKDMAVIHVEKANPEIRGLYTVINQEFCQRAWSEAKYINREEDMGIEGLRRAKSSYHPKYLLDKFTAKVTFGE